MTSNLCNSLCAALLLAASAAAQAVPSTEVTVSGDVLHPATLTLPDLQAQPAVTQTVTFNAGNTPQTHTYVGASLWGTLNAAGIVVDPGVNNDILRKFVVATGSDGYSVIYSMGEIDPNFGARPALIAYAETIGGTTTPLGSDGFARTTAPGDIRGGRYVSNLVDLDVRTAMPAQGSVGGGPSSAFTVGGAVTASMLFDLVALQALPQSTQTVGGVVYTGVSLWSLLTSTVGIPTDPGVRNDVLGKYVVATGTDGYTVTFSLGELSPLFGNQPDFIAYAADGAPLGADGFARLVVPNDVRRGRWVSNLLSLEVFSVPEPTSAMLFIAGLLAITAIGSRGARRVPAPAA